ncbi:hypothetical protein SteCoe_12970 [Stentor coeruleus]|uniref:Uncharacterized protein n=1 Tax=Stentor coeruleus TaxID=5963 RepID=A0A1R2C9P9_9CILI|nr:hypothetical protein SteCoe_12970 [Stentor coeruleus]
MALSGINRNISLIVLLMLIGFFLLSIYVLSLQESKETIYFQGPKLSDADKANIISYGLSKDIPIRGSIDIWESINYSSSELASNILNFEGKSLEESLVCTPLGFGYSKTQSDKIFDPLANYQICEEVNPEFIKYNKTHLINDCKGDSFYSLGSAPEDEIFGRVSYDFSWNNFDSDVETKNHEFAFVKCNEKRNAEVFLKYNSIAVERARNITKSIENDLGIKSPGRPLTVFLVIFDSLSRHHMYRSFPKSLKYLNDTIVKGEFKDNFIMHDFLINHAHGENTIPNMIPYLFGYSFNYHRLRLKKYDYKNPEHQQAFKDIQKDSIWKHYEKMGFITMFGFDIIWDFLVPAVGRKVLADHVFTNFWKASSKVFGTDNYINIHSCFGSHDSHYYMLKYVQEYLKTYEGVNRFGYIHITTAHEKSGTIIKTVDDDLHNFLQTVLKQYNDNNEDIVLILGGDHGKHVSETDFIREGWLENMLPAQIIITNKNFVQKMNAEKNLNLNVKRLISRPDWHLTLKHLSTSPYGLLKKDSNLYKHWKTTTETDNIISIFMEESPTTRTCKDLNIEEYLCVCLPYREITREEIKSSIFITEIINLSIQSINQSKNSLICQKLTFNKIIYAAERLIEEGLTIYRLRITINENIDVVFEAFGSVFSEKTKDFYLKENVLMPYKVVGKKEKFIVQLLKAVRIDGYAGYYEEIALAINEKAPYCIPKLPKEFNDMDFTQEKIISTFDRILEEHTIRLTKANNTCNDECKKYDSVCQPWIIMLFSNKNILMQSWHAERLYQIYYEDGLQDIDLTYYEPFYTKNILGVLNKTLYIPESEYSCDLSDFEIQMICPCK